MPRYLGAACIVLLPALVLFRVGALKRQGIVAIKFGRTDKTDYLIAPFALFYVYLICANAFRWPAPRFHAFFRFAFVDWIGALVCVSALCFMSLAMVSFGSSFRVGIDTEQADRLVTTGIFGITRNPLYVAFGLMLIGEFLLQPNELMLLYLFAGFAVFHRQVLREEKYLFSHYGAQYEAYLGRVPRYL